MLLFLVEIALLEKQRGRGLALVGAIHTWAHSSFVLLPALAVAAVAARFVRRERLLLQLCGWALAGPVFASIVHPYFPNNLSIAWDQLAEVARNVWLGSDAIPRDLFGSELKGMLTSDFLGWAPAFLPAVFGLFAFLAARRRVSTDALALLLTTGVLLAAGFLSYRFMEFFLPVVVVLGARLWSELADGAALRELARRDARMAALSTVPLALCLVAALSKNSVFGLHRELAGTVAPTERQRPAVDRSLFEKSVAILNGTAQDPYTAIRKDFGARWVYLSRSSVSPRAIGQFLGDKRFIEVYQDESALIYRLD